MLFLKRGIMYFIYNFHVQNLHSRCLQNLPEEKAGGNFGPNSSVASSSCFGVGNEEMPESVVAVTLSMKKTKLAIFERQIRKYFFQEVLKKVQGGFLKTFTKAN